MYPFCRLAGTTAAVDRYGSYSSPESFPSLAGRKEVTMDSSAVTRNDSGASIPDEAAANMARRIEGIGDTGSATRFAAAASEYGDVGSTLLDALNHCSCYHGLSLSCHGA